MMFIIMAGYSHCAGFAFLRHFCQFAVNSRHLQGTAKVAGESGEEEGERVLLKSRNNVGLSHLPQHDFLWLATFLLAGCGCCCYPRRVTHTKGAHTHTLSPLSLLLHALSLSFSIWQSYLFLFLCVAHGAGGTHLFCCAFHSFPPTPTHTRTPLLMCIYIVYVYVYVELLPSRPFSSFGISHAARQSPNCVINSKMNNARLPVV